jgi:hypothetical protein
MSTSPLSNVKQTGSVIVVAFLYSEKDDDDKYVILKLIDEQ